MSDFPTSNGDVLDMETGGGEFLSTLHHLPHRVRATEGYEPNLAIARKVLEPRGIRVDYVPDTASLPYEDGSFSLVLNRQGSFDADELFRILSPGGIFLTQQVGGLNSLNLNAALRAPFPPHVGWDLSLAINELLSSGFDISSERQFVGYSRCTDIAALVMYLQRIPWQIPGFRWEDSAKDLLDIHRHIQRSGYYEVLHHRFTITARRTEH